MRERLWCPWLARPTNLPPAPSPPPPLAPADGSSAPEWDEELALPAELVGLRLTALPLSLEQEGEPALFVWTDGSVDGGEGEAACRADPELGGQPGGSGGGGGGGGTSDAAFQLWSYSASAGWQRRGYVQGLGLGLAGLCTQREPRPAG